MKPLPCGMARAGCAVLLALSASAAMAAPEPPKTDSLAPPNSAAVANLTIDHGDRPNRGGGPTFVVSTGKSAANINGLFVRRVEVTHGDMAFEVANGWSLSTTTPGCKVPPTTQKAFRQCSFILQPNDTPLDRLGLPEPGSHRIRMALIDGNGEIRNFDLLADRHWGWIWLLLALVAGTGGGVLVGRWRDGGRAQVQQLLAVNSARAQLHAALAGTAFGASQLLGLADDLAKRIAAEPHDLQAEVAELQRRIGIATRLIDGSDSTSAEVISGTLVWLGDRPDGLVKPVSTAEVEEKLQQLTPAVVMAQAMAPAGAQALLPISATQLEPDSAPADLRRQLRWQDGKVHYILLSLFVLVAFVAQWSATWGGIGDVVTAVATGFGAWATLNQGVDVLVSTARRRT